LKTSGIFSRGTGSVVMKFDSEQQKLQVEASSQDIGQSSVDLAAEVSGEAGSIILNYRYVLDALTAMSSPSVVIKIVNEGSPVIFQPQDDNTYTYLVMPIKS
jgi:DNA polymerase-3 subunit beta